MAQIVINKYEENRSQRNRKPGGEAQRYNGKLKRLNPKREHSLSNIQAEIG